MWVFIAAGFVVGSLIFIKLAKRNRVKLSILSENSIFIFIITLAVSRLFFIISNTDLYFYHITFKSLFSIFAIWDKGLSFWGAIIGWFVGLIYLSKKRNESIIKIVDLMMPAILIGMFFGNIGTFLDGINYGKPTGLPWGMVFRSANVKYISPIHPTQLYSAIYTLLLGGFLIVLLKRIRGNFSGAMTELGCFLFSCFKFIEEFFRGDETMKILGIRFMHILALLGIILSAYLIYKHKRIPQILSITKLPTPDSQGIEAKRNLP